ncbi:hypothetical protein OS493_008130, partial [Desmophyllum pertusum]
FNPTMHNLLRSHPPEEENGLNIFLNCCTMYNVMLHWQQFSWGLHLPVVVTNVRRHGLTKDNDFLKDANPSRRASSTTVSRAEIPSASIEATRKRSQMPDRKK